MDIFVKIETRTGDHKAAVPQIRYLQAGERATPIEWGVDGKGHITNLNLASSTLLPVTLMVQTDGRIDKHGLSSQYIDCLKTFHVVRTDVKNQTIMHEMQHGDLNIRVTLSPFADFGANGSLLQYESAFVEDIKQNIAKGNTSIKTCLAMLTTGISLPQALCILSGKGIEINDSKREAVQNLRYALLESDSKASTGLAPMHNTVVTRTLDRIQANLPLDLKRGFFSLLQARKYCQDAKIPIAAQNVNRMRLALCAVLQYQSVLIH